MPRLPVQFRPDATAPRQRRGWRARAALVPGGAAMAPRGNRLHVVLPAELPRSERFTALWTLEDELCSAADTDFGPLSAFQPF